MHIPVLLNEAIQWLDIEPSGIYLDATFGRGGHAKKIFNTLDANGQLIVMDKDQQACQYAKEVFAERDNVHIVNASFAKLDETLQLILKDKKLDGALFDLGVCSTQLDTAERGFSFRKEGPLDMRMDKNSKITAKVWIESASQKQMRQVFSHYGEERYANRIANAIIEARKNKTFHSTTDLANFIADVVPSKELKKHPATRVFQAIRIHINNELEEIKLALERILNWLNPDARLVVISFHSLEDRIVKQFMKEKAKGDDFPIDLPVTAAMLNPKLKLLSKPIYPSAQECKTNPRSRSAVLRVAQMVGA